MRKSQLRVVSDSEKPPAPGRPYFTKDNFKKSGEILLVLFLVGCVVNAIIDTMGYVMLGPRCSGTERPCVFGPGILGT